MSRARRHLVAIAAALAASACAAQPKAIDQAPRPATPAAFSSDEYESSPTFSRDGREVVFMRADPRFSRFRLLWSRCGPGGWSAPRPLPFARADVSEADPAFSGDGRWLYYISAQGNVDGNFDIWRVERDAGGGWGEPQRLPTPVNSPASELLPRPLPDGRLLFGSSREGGHGQGDIYLATPLPDGGWRVDNAGPPLSTPANEYEAEISRDGTVMVIVADRGDRSHLHVFDLRAGAWIERGRVPARPDVFQVGPLLSPAGDRLLFAQAADAAASGELFLVDLQTGADASWPPVCAARGAR